MEVYAFQGDLYCLDCGMDIKLNTPVPSHTKTNGVDMDENSYDSYAYPKGPYLDGGGEADSPAHCGNCMVHLENSLTTDGEEYVKDAVKDALGGQTAREWKEYYSYLF